MPISEAYLIYALAWLSFGLGHSVLARSQTKARLEPRLGAYYRLLYNGVALVHILGVWWVGKSIFENAGFALPNYVQIALTAISVLGLIILVAALRHYDLGQFAGTAQIRGPKEDLIEPLHLTGLHTYVRHPIYAGATLILWGNAQDDFGLATALFGSVYLVIGTWLEERQLVETYGDAYRDYRRKVPAVVPWRGKAV